MSPSARAIVAVLALLSACATVRESYAPDGRKAHSLNCSGTARGWDKCFSAAGEICGANGYDVIDRNSEGRSYGAVAVNPSGGYGSAGTTSERTMLIACKAAPIPRSTSTPAAVSQVQALPSTPSARASTSAALPHAEQSPPITLAAANNSTIRVTLGPDWKQTPPSESLGKQSSFRMRATNAKIDAGLLVVATDSADVGDHVKWAQSHTARIAGAISNASSTEPREVKVGGRAVLQTEVAGTEKSGMRVRYLNSYMRGEREFVTVTLWTSESRYLVNRSEFEAVVAGVQF